MNYSVMFPRGNIYARGKFIGQKRNAFINAVGRMNDNPILDTRKFRVEFDDGEFSELTENVITESMHDACDDYEIEYVMMDYIVEYQKNDKDISVPDHKVVHRGHRFIQ